MKYHLQYLSLKQRLRLLFCVHNVVSFYDHQMNIVKYFSVDSINSEFGNKENVEFYWFFYYKWRLKYFKY